MKHLVMIVVLLTAFIGDTVACPFRRPRCRISNRSQCQVISRNQYRAGFIVRETQELRVQQQIDTSQINEPQIESQQNDVIQIEPEEIIQESGPPAPSLELVKSSENEEACPKVTFELTSVLSFDLYTQKINLSKLEAVKAFQEETPTVNLSSLGEVKASNTEPSVAITPKASKQESDFALTDEPLNDEYPSPASNIFGAEIEYNIGDLVELSVEPADKPNGLISVDYTWTVLPNVTSRVWPDKTKILFGTGSKNLTYVVILNTSYVFGERDPQGNIENIVQKTSVTMANVKVGGGTTETSSNDLSGLSRLAYEWTYEVTKTENYNKSQLMIDAGKLSESFRTISNEIKSGALTDVGSIIKRTKENNDSTIENRNEWLPWFTKMSEHLQTSYNNGTIKSLDDFSEAWLEISKGLEAAAK